MSLVSHTPVPIEAGAQSLFILAVSLRPRWMQVYLHAAGCKPIKNLYRAEARVRTRFPHAQTGDFDRLVRQEIEQRQRQIEYRRLHIMRQKVLPYVYGELAAGHFTIRGTLPTGEYRDIDRTVVQTASIDVEAGTISSPGGGPVWYNVSAELKEMFVSPTTTKAADDQTPNRPKPTRAAIIAWIRARVETWPDDQPPPSEEADWFAASTYFDEGLRRDEDFRPMRKEEVPPEWRKQGKRKDWGLIKTSARNSAKPRPQI